MADKAWLWMVDQNTFAVYIEGESAAVTFSDPMLACVYAQSNAENVICEDSPPDFLFEQ